MRALLVYESMFGNTEQITKAVRKGLERHGDVEMMEVSNAPDVIGYGVDVLVVGAPTHAFGLSRPSTRKSAADQRPGRPLVSQGRGVREWLESLRVHRKGLPAACFGTRIAVPKLPGTASHKLHRRLARMGFRQPIETTDFFVSGMEGPLVDGELKRAEEWGYMLGSRLMAGAGTYRGSAREISSFDHDECSYRKDDEGSQQHGEVGRVVPAENQGVARLVVVERREQP
jgi:hypothetical protein